MTRSPLFLAEEDYANGRKGTLVHRFFSGPKLQNNWLVVGYLVALAIAESVVAFVAPIAGIMLYGVLLVIILIHAARIWEHELHKVLLSLAFAPLIRILSLSLPLVGFPLEYWYLFTGIPLFIAMVLATRMLGYNAKMLGVNSRWLPFQLVVGVTGFGFGFIEYLILRPDPLVESMRWEQIWLPALILLVCTGFVEEFIFRGLLQQSATALLGKSGPVFVAILFAVLHLGYRSLADFVFVLLVGLFFGWVVFHTGSIVGVTISHGLTNITLFLIVPFLPFVEPSATSAASSLTPMSPVLPSPTTTLTDTLIPTLTAVLISSPVLELTGTPTPTPTILPTVEEATVTISSPEAQLGAILDRQLYQTDFSAGWPSISEAHTQCSIVDGQYLCTVGPLEAWFLATTDISEENLYVQVEVTPEECPEMGGYGLAFRYVDPSNLCLLTVFCNGRYTIVELVDGVVIRGGSGMLPPDLRADSAEMHTLGIMTRGNRFAIYFDYQEIGSFNNSRAARGDVGIYVANQDRYESLLRVAFDNLEVWSVH